MSGQFLLLPDRDLKTQQFQIQNMAMIQNLFTGEFLTINADDEFKVTSQALMQKEDNLMF